MDVMIFKGAQVRSLPANTARLVATGLMQLGACVQHLEEVKQQYKVRAQLHYFFRPPDHTQYANTHGAQREAVRKSTAPLLFFAHGPCCPVLCR